MIDLVGIPSFLRIALWVAMATIAFSHSPNRFIFGEHFFFRIQSIPENNLTPIKNCPWGMQGKSN